MRAAYPKLGLYGNGAKATPVPGNSSAVYRFDFHDGKVAGIVLEDRQQDCAS